MLINVIKIICKFIYKIIFCISRAFSILVFIICLSTILNLKYIMFDKYWYLLDYFILGINDFITNTGIIHYNIFDYKHFAILCKNAQAIDLLLIALAIILIISIIVVKTINKECKHLLAINIIINSVVYLVMYLIFKLSIMLALAIFTPLILIIILFLNKICPIQKTIMLIPIIGEIFCTKKIIKYIFKKASDNIMSIYILTISLILSNILCFLFSYKNIKDFENRIINNFTYSIRTYKDKMIISGTGEWITIEKDGNTNYIENEQFYFEDFIINESKGQIYSANFIVNSLVTNFLTLDIKTFEIKKTIITPNNSTSRISCNNTFSKLILIPENNLVSLLIDLNTYKIKYLKGISKARDGLIYNKFRKCFLVSFQCCDYLQEIDIENKKMRKIKADKYQGYLTISERNKEIYVAFNQQGRIGIYDAQTMKLKRKIKTNYTVKNITYDEELNILIAPSYFTGYVDIFLMDGSDKLLTREFVGYELREGCFDPQKENLYICSATGLYKKQIDIKKLIKQNSNVSHETKN